MTEAISFGQPGAVCIPPKHFLMNEWRRHHRVFYSPAVALEIRQKAALAMIAALGLVGLILHWYMLAYQGEDLSLQNVHLLTKAAVVALLGVCIVGLVAELSSYDPSIAARKFFELFVNDRVDIFINVLFRGNTAYFSDVVFLHSDGHSGNGGIAI